MNDKIKIFLVGCDYVAATSFDKAVEWYIKTTGVDTDEAVHDEAGETGIPYDRKFQYWEEDSGETRMVSWNDLIAECESFPTVVATSPIYV